MLTADKCFDTGLFRHLNNPAFCRLQFKKPITSEAHFFFKSIQNFMHISKVKKKFEKISFYFQVIAFKLVALNTRFYLERILFIGCQYVNKQSQNFVYFYERIFRADFLSVCSRIVIKIMPRRFKQSFGAFDMLTTHKCSDTGLFRYLNNPAFCSLYFQKQITSEAHLFFQSIRNFKQISKIKRKNQKIFFVFQIIAFELVALNTRLFLERILFIGCQYVNKQSQDFRYY